jgi:ech hydrogenase subunit D
MSQEQIEIITLDALLAQAQAKRDQGCRLVQISATQLPDQVELTYSFDHNPQLTNFRLNLPNGNHLLSISGIFGCAVLYENEIHDLFGVPVDGLSIDFKGNFYKTAVKFPFGSTNAPAAASASGPAAGGPATAATPEAKK